MIDIEKFVNLMEKNQVAEADKVILLIQNDQPIKKSFLIWLKNRLQSPAKHLIYDSKGKTRAAFLLMLEDSFTNGYLERMKDRNEMQR